jgi:protocatechuate 3,4-dioxygenase beta subunit
MLKLIISSLLVLALCSSGLPQKNCQCRKATADDKTIWGHIATEVQEKRPVKKLHGIIHDALGERLENALVEVFADDGTEITPTSDSNIRVAACLTGEKGKFCFDGLKPGKYILAVGHQGFNITFIKLTLDPKGRRSSGKPLEVSLELGT